MLELPRRLSDCKEILSGSSFYLGILRELEREL